MDILCNKVSFQELLNYFDNDLENNAWNLEHNVEKLGNSENNTFVLYGLAMMQIELNLVNLFRIIFYLESITILE